jgi:hypothetical protein
MIKVKIETTDGNVEVGMTITAIRENNPDHEKFVAQMVTDAVADVLAQEQIARKGLRLTRLVWE